MKYRLGGKEKRISLGVYPDVLLKEARRRRSQARQLLAREIDPSEHRKAQKAARPERSANSFEAVAREWFLKHSPHWATSYSGRMLRRLERDIFPWIGDKPIAVIRAPELLAVVRQIEQRGAMEMAHRALRTCGQVLRYAVATGRAERDPTGDLRGALFPIKRTHFAALTEPKQVGPFLKDPEAKVLFDLGKPRYTPSGITREHLLAVLEAIREGEPVDRDIWVRNDPDRELSGLPPKTTGR